MINRKIQITPSLLAADITRLGDEVKALESAGADALHIDIMDGQFTPNITFGFPVIKSLRKVTSLPFDTHLMIAHPDRYIDKFHEVGCNWLSVHVESCPHIDRTIHHIQELGMKAGVAINPGTSIFSLEGVVDLVDYVLVMSVNPGFGGQKLIPRCFDRVREIKKNLKNPNTKIQMDGGITQNNIKEAVTAGVDIIVMGVAFFEATDYQAKITDLRKVVDT